MGAWGAGIFENEYAQGWLDQLAQLTAADLTPLLARADTADYLEAAESSVVIAAAEAVAALRGAPAEAAPKVRKACGLRHLPLPNFVRYL